jgi:hypothetical protein
MTKVQQKISGCFKSTAQKHGVTPTDALKTLFDGKLPEAFFTN